jgi:hypothetical protein
LKQRAEPFPAITATGSDQAFEQKMFVASYRLGRLGHLPNSCESENMARLSAGGGRGKKRKLRTVVQMAIGGDTSCVLPIRTGLV